MGAIMANAAVAAGLAAAGSNIIRPGGAATKSRVDAVRPVAQANSSGQGFANAVTIAVAAESQTARTVGFEPGKGMLTNGVQLILAETRAQEDAAAFTDRSSVDRALTSYSETQASIRETIGLAKIRAGSAPPPAQQAVNDTAA